MRNIYLFVGPSGVGKTTIVEKLSRDYGFSVVSSYTDRPMRYDGETGHVFLTKEEFDALPELCAYTEFNGHRYGVTSDMVDNCDLYVIDPAGVDYFRKHYSGIKKPIVIGFIQDEAVLYERMLKRGDSEEKARERLVHDKEAFKNMSMIADILIPSSDVQNVADIIHEYIENSELYAQSGII